jgi:hypothetical protein
LQYRDLTWWSIASMSSREAHKKAYKSRTTVEEARLKRQQENVSIRKQKREEHVAKRRQMTKVNDNQREEFARLCDQV